ncbi:hypothetical protein D3C81_1936160 [compost metagenome]
MGTGSGELDHVFGLAHVIQPDRGNQHAAGGAVEDGVEQHRAQRAFAQLVEDLANPKTQERLVFQRLHRPLGHRLDERLHGLAGKGQFKQTRRLLRRGDGVTPGFEWQWHDKFVDLRKSVHG